jgi:vancomycin resistance protein YoaR
MVFGGWGLERDKLKSRLTFALVLLLGITGAFAWYVYKNYINTDFFVPGIEIGGIAVQGNNLEAAAKAVSLGINEMYAAKVSFHNENYSHESKLGDLCLPVDAVKIVESAWQEEKARSWVSKIANLNGNQKISYPVNIPYNPEAKAHLIQEWDHKWGIPFKNASLEVDSRRGLITVPGQAGIKIDGEATFMALPTQLSKISSIRAPIILVHQEPSVNEETLNNMGELSSYSTFFNTKEVNRSNNLYTATNSINKSIIDPQTVFSFNNTVGIRTMERGYLDALVIVGNKFEPGLGGGICQVSSTLYNAALLAGLEIVERSNHGLAVAYVPLGRDATVAYGIQDFKFRNNTNSPVYIRAITGGGTLTVNVYGDLKYKKRINISNIIDQTIDFITVKELDLKLLPGEQKVDHNGNPGYVVRSFRNFYDNNGKIIKTEQLARDTYKPLNKLILEGPQIAPAVASDGSDPPTGENGSGNGSQSRLDSPEQIEEPLLPDNSTPNITNTSLPGGVPIKPSL